jgi:hypothetical protein
MWTSNRQNTAQLTGAYNAELSKADVAIDYLFRFDADRDGHIGASDIEAALKTLKQARVASGWSLYRSGKDSSVNEKVSMFNETQFLNESKAFYEALLALGRGSKRPEAEALGLRASPGRGDQIPNQALLRIPPKARVDGLLSPRT